MPDFNSLELVLNILACPPIAPKPSPLGGCNNIKPTKTIPIKASITRNKVVITSLILAKSHRHFKKTIHQIRLRRVLFNPSEANISSLIETNNINAS